MITVVIKVLHGYENDTFFLLLLLSKSYVTFEPLDGFSSLDPEMKRSRSFLDCAILNIKIKFKINNIF